MNMKLISFELYKARIPLKKPFVTSLGSEDTSEHIFVKAISDNGMYGWGECAPYIKINSETVDSALCIAQLLIKAVTGMDPSDHEGIYRKMEAVVYGNQSIKSAIDIACYDIASKAAGQPLFEYLGGLKEKKLQTDYTVSVGSIEEMVADAEEIVAMGFKILKIKLGDDGAMDVKRIRAIRNAIGNHFSLRIDANQGWEIEEAKHTLKLLEPFNIDYCEAPINRGLSFKLNQIKASTTIPIMADESLFTHFDAERLLAGNHCDAFNLKLGKTGGIFEARRIIAIAEKNEIPMQIGGFVESKIVFTANCHLATTSKWVRYIDADCPLFHAYDPVIGGLEYNEHGFIALPKEPGIGVELADSFLNKCQKTVINSQ